MHYYNLKRYWHKVEPHIENREVQYLLVRDFNRYTMGRWNQRFQPGMLPRAFETCDWDIDHPDEANGIAEREPAFWQYTKHAACHWIVNFTLELAKLSLPERKWRIISSQDHSTVWDGEAFRLATRNGWELGVGKRLRVFYAEHHSIGR